MAPGKAKRKARLSGIRLILWSFGLGAIAIFLLLAFGGRILWDPAPRAPLPDAARPPLDREASVRELAVRLEPLARWDVRRDAPSLYRRGKIPSAQSLVQWNARVSREIEDLGLEVLSGIEELETQPGGRLPLQRLTLTAGCAGESLATIVVETTRARDLPPAF